MADRQAELARLRSAAEEALRRAGEENMVAEERRGELEGELRVEREWRQSLAKDQDKMSSLQQEIAQLKAVAAVSIQQYLV